jgi:hypothetical protein
LCRYSENEDNALICLRIIFDLHRNFRPSLESEVAPFLQFVCEVYKVGLAADCFPVMYPVHEHTLHPVGPQRVKAPGLVTQPLKPVL